MGAAMAGAPMAAAAGGTQLIGDILQGIGQQQAMNLSKQQFNQQFGLQSGEYADALASQMQLGGLRDQVVYQLMNNLGQSPRAFNPLNYGAPTNTGQQGVGGYDLNQEANHAAQYTPGAGGTNTNVAQATLGMLGYNNQSDIQQAHNAGSTNYNYAGTNYANGTGPLGSETAGRGPGYTLSSGTSSWKPGKGVAAGNNYDPSASSHAGYSLGGGGAPGTITPSGPGTSGWGGLPPGGQLGGLNPMSAYPTAARVAQGSLGGY